MRHRMRTRAGAALSVVVMVSALTVLFGSSPAGATTQPGPDNCAAPSQSDCPAGTDHWTDATNVIQNSSGGTNFFKCGADSCVGVQNNTTGDNKADVDQTKAANGAQIANLTQTNVDGKNLIDVDQNASVVSTLTTLANVAQSSDQNTTTDQVNVRGINHQALIQSVTHIASGTVNLPEASQSQEAHQDVHVVRMEADSGDQDLTIGQNENLSQSLNTPQAKQEQNTAEKIGQKIVIGSPLTEGVDSDSQVAVNITQESDFLQQASGVSPLNTLLKSSQVQGAQNESFPAGLLDWDITSAKSSGSHAEAHQDKSWIQETTPDEPPLGKVQDMWDELDIIGRLKTVDTSNTSQTATLVQDGSRQRCVQRADVHNEDVGTNKQNCNGEKQEATGEHYKMHLERCKGFDNTVDCNESESFVEVSNEREEIDETGEFGCGQGFWKEHPELWPNTEGSSVQPGDLFVDHFEAGAGYANTRAPTTMMQAISFSGGGSTLEGAAGNLARAAVAALLNAEHNGVPYELRTDAVVAKTDDALDSRNRLGMLDLAKEFEGYNNGPNCPLA